MLYFNRLNPSQQLYDPFLHQSVGIGPWLNMVPLLLFLAITQLTTSVSVWDTTYNTGQLGMHIETKLSMFPPGEVTQSSHGLESHKRKKPENAMEGFGEELSRSTRGVLSSLLCKARGKVKVLKTWYKGNQAQDQDHDEDQGSQEGQPSLFRSPISISTSSLTVREGGPFAFSQSSNLTTRIASSSLPTRHGPWVSVGRIASPSNSLTQASQGSRLGQSSCWWDRLKSIQKILGNV